MESSNNPRRTYIEWLANDDKHFKDWLIDLNQYVADATSLDLEAFAPTGLLELYRKFPDAEDAYETLTLLNPILRSMRNSPDP